MKRQFMLIGDVIGMKRSLLIVLYSVLLVFVLAVVFGFVIAVKRMPEFRKRRAEERDARVKEYVMNLYEEKPQSIVITGSSPMGTGNPVPFAGKLGESEGDGKNRTYIYKLLIDGKYNATVWVDWETDSFELRESEYPGTPLMP